MVEIYNLRVSPAIASSESRIAQYVSQHEQIDLQRIAGVRIRKRSIDARQRNVFVQLTVEAFIDEPMPSPVAVERHYPDVSASPQAIVVGAGPAGLFAALRLIELGVRPVVLERGEEVRARHRTLSSIPHSQQINPESNYSFGEGGAGAFSDGKLDTRSKKRGSTDRILETFVYFGASPQILVDAHPHIGTNKLPRIIESMRRQIIASGGEVHFLTRVDSLLMRLGSVVGVTTADGREYCGRVILATGHSARDVYRQLHHQRIEQEVKGIAVGVRLEHPQSLIDQIIYHSPKGRGDHLPAAAYSLVKQVGGRGVYSFCMCPGGFVVPASTANEEMVVNGMSPANRGSQWANSGMVVELRPEDVGARSPLAMMEWQEKYERLCWQHGGGGQVAPAQRMTDFVRGTLSNSLPSSSYAPGLHPSPLHQWLPSHVGRRLQEGFSLFGQQYRGFLSDEATLIGVESRTSSPIRIPRDHTSLEHLTTSGLYPCGEGAGYAGGIVSAAIDGERSAEALQQAIAL